jgi:multidrug efflux pump
MGVVPLVIASGAGAEMRRVMGVAVFSGMLGVTFFGLLFTPMFYVIVRGLVERRTSRDHVAPGGVRSWGLGDQPLTVGEEGAHA